MPRREDDGANAAAASDADVDCSVLCMASQETLEPGRGTS